MTTYQQTLLSNYFTAVLPFCNQQKVLELFAKLGYQVEEATADLCIQACEESGVEFYKPFGRIAEVAIASPKFEAYLKNLQSSSNIASANLVKATGTKSTLTNDQKIEVANNVLGTLTSWFSSGSQLADTLINKDTNAANAQAALLLAQSQANQENASATQKWLIPVIIGVVVLILAVVLIVVKGKQK